MLFEMEQLSYGRDRLEPIMSQMTLDFHYGKHYLTYINNLDKLIQGTKFADMSMGDIIRESDGAIFNNAAQASNHALFFSQLAHSGKELKDEALMKAIDTSFGSFAHMQQEMSDKAKKLFGSGWVWLASDAKGKLEIKEGSNAYTPIVDGYFPLACIDVWEHAYYIDYQNRRADYVDSLWDILDWQVIGHRYKDVLKK